MLEDQLEIILEAIGLEEMLEQIGITHLELVVHLFENGMLDLEEFGVVLE